MSIADVAPFVASHSLQDSAGEDARTDDGSLAWCAPGFQVAQRREGSAETACDIDLVSRLRTRSRERVSHGAKYCDRQRQFMPIGHVAAEYRRC